MSKRMKYFKFLAFGLSLLAHIIILFCFRQAAVRPPMELTNVDDIEVQGHRVVRSAKSLDPTPPKDSKLWGERDQTVKKQTVAPKETPPSAERKTSAPRTADAQGLSLGDLGLSGNTEEIRSALEGSAAMAGSLDDYVPGTVPGMQTYLNTRQYAHWSFMERIREIIAPGWKADIQKKIGDMRFAGLRLESDEMVSRVAVKLDAKGKLLVVAFLQQSGSEMLDEAAVAAFENARQFPNPPKQLISPEGHVTIHWTFTVKQPQIKLTSAR